MIKEEEGMCPNCNHAMVYQSFVSDIVLFDTVQLLCPECGYHFEIETAN